ncbi:MAG: tRNA glutamyl-Q(34) synthetase GluQRS [Solirubrobacterales bacterium]|nr:tRNA glutamyl-Q(34) synthetase GluQRS [Solirubrobacterales bacterium]
MLTGRFAPSPTGPLHLGSLRTALAAWLFARKAGGEFLLRVEDLDPSRCKPIFETEQLQALRALGIDWDGPVVRQSDRLSLYAAALAKLPVYRCYCTRAELAQRPCNCRQLGGSGDRFALRFDARGTRIRFQDVLAGPQSFEVDDFIVRRADGVFSYQLAVVVDDFQQEVTQVVRGADLLDSTARQILLARTLGYPVAQFAHVPLVMGPDGKRLAKRYGASTVLEDPLPWLGASLGIETDEQPKTAADLLEGFAPDAIPEQPVSLA